VVDLSRRGLAGMAWVDGNYDGRLTAVDPVWNELKVWQGAGAICGISKKNLKLFDKKSASGRLMESKRETRRQRSGKKNGAADPGMVEKSHCSSLVAPFFKRISPQTRWSYGLHQ
jgi:hypothetical protein